MSMTIEEIFAKIEGSDDSFHIKSVLNDIFLALPKDDTSLEGFQKTFDVARKLQHDENRRACYMNILNNTPRTPAYTKLLLELIDIALTDVDRTKDPRHRKSAINRITEEIPNRPEFKELYIRSIKMAIDASDKIIDTSIKRHSLLELAKLLEDKGELEELRLFSLRVALGLTGLNGYTEYTLEMIAKELPKTCDYTFYRNSTFLGIAGSLPKKGEFIKLYSEAIKIAIEASCVIDEPYYKKYALTFIANELKERGDLPELYREALERSFDAARELSEPFVRQHALLEILTEVPKTPDYYPMLLEVIRASLPFFSFRSRSRDLNKLEILDLLIVAEEKKLKESKKKKYNRLNYATRFCDELKKFSGSVDDIRFIDVLKPYTHIWVRPKKLRDTLKEIVTQISELKKTFHGKEVTRPIFIKEHHGEQKKPAASKASYSGKTISIDLGATNTVIMTKDAGAPPTYVTLEGISKKFGDVVTVPTYIDPESSKLTPEKYENLCSINIKKLMLDGSPKGIELMDSFFSLIFKAVKKSVGVATGRENRLCLTVPVGFAAYKEQIAEIVKNHAPEYDTVLIEEPLAAAIGYQVSEDTDKFVFVIDFGGCTMDCMILRINNSEVNVVAKPDRSTMLGGRDVDLWLSELLRRRCLIGSTDVPVELISAAEEIKIQLSDHSETPFIWKDKEICKVSREHFEKIMDDREFYKDVDRAISYTMKRGAKVGVTKDSLDAVILTGGSSQISSFKEKVGHTFPMLRDKNLIYDHSPLSAVARGGALYGTSDITDRHLGMPYAIKFSSRGSETPYSYDVLLESGDRLPFKKTFSMNPAKTLGTQREMFIELFEVPEA
ncbi:MAG: Hsp70 family protein, partial [Deltaproteobacteria bacterium]|nr:Hsp70 family protein [Deltaproteobacteria bacterium]